MSDSPRDLHYIQQLRKEAESALKNGNAPAGHAHFLSTEALSVVFKLANSYESAADSLKLLHELQTHQIELELQLEQSAANERETEQALDHYKALYQFAPVGYITINREGGIIESNLAGSALLGLDCSELEGPSLENFLTPDSWLIIKWQLGKLFNGSTGESGTVMAAYSNETRPLLVTTRLAPEGNLILMTISESERPAPI